ncbi:MAG: 50S ribosomal protein L29 [Anaerolineae bacterium]|nr:50S ribosomal protein L29 [Anaerolineae bacterium]
MDAAEIREMTLEDIKKELEDARKELMMLRFQTTTGELTDYTQMKFSRRKIARMLTILREKQSAAGTEGDE